ncbi:MAG TPA: RNA polymerase sigma factor [Pirellulales bacterium]|nr:RNA polymerase sigma factor [Pirellulales bacterium]
MNDETALIEAAKQGDREAFAAIVARHQGAVFGYLRARLLQLSDAEDLTQEVFLRCYSARARFDSANLIGPWLIGIARNLLREYARKRKRRREVAWTELCLEVEERAKTECEAPNELISQLSGCLDLLGPAAREAIKLRYGAKLRLSEIGAKLARSEGAAKLLMFRARQALKYCLERRGRGANHD